MGATVTIPATFKAVDRFSHVLKSMGMGTKNFAKMGISSMQRFDAKINQTFKSMGRISQVALGISAGALFSSAIQANIDYNKSLMSVSSITGATGKNLTILERNAMGVANSTKMMAKDVLIGFEEIASAKPELLKTPDLLADITKNAIILSKASGLDLKMSADALTTSLNQFGLGAEKSLMAIDALAAGSVYGSSKIPQTADALAKFGTIAAATGTTLNESIALIQLVSPFEKGAEAGTKLRNILATIASAKILPKDQLNVLRSMGVDIEKVANSALPLNTRLMEFGKIATDNNAVMKVFGKENSALAQALFNNAGGFAEMLKNIGLTGAAQAQADKNMSSLGARITAIKNQFFNVTTATNSENNSLRLLGSTMDWVANNMEMIVGIGGSAVAIFGGMKAITLGAQAAAIGYNVVIGAQAALSKTAAISIGQNSVALGAYKAMQVVSTGVTWLATAATTAFGVAINLASWPILALIAIIGGVIALFYNWDNVSKWFSKQWGKFTSWIGEAWDNVVSWIKDFDFVAFFKRIGQSVLKFVLAPIQMMLKMASRLPGVGNMAKGALDKISHLTGEREALAKSRERLDGPELIMVKSNNDVKKAIHDSNVNVNFNDPNNMVKSVDASGPNAPAISLNKTQGAF
ncbi:phage tail tape measure protein [Flagellimonas sp.]|uniref:phage tail tape measure protein n=1 Tax=Flagellimonas sp. TaxID=2058762 RepID=UPI003BB21B64